RRRHTRFSRDWSSDVCSSDLSRAPDGRRVKGVSLPRRAFSRPMVNRGSRTVLGAPRATVARGRPAPRPRREATVNVTTNAYGRPLRRRLLGALMAPAIVLGLAACDTNQGISA